MSEYVLEARALELMSRSLDRIKDFQGKQGVICIFERSYLISKQKNFSLKKMSELSLEELNVVNNRYLIHKWDFSKEFIILFYPALTDRAVLQDRVEGTFSGQPWSIFDFPAENVILSLVSRPIFSIFKRCGVCGKHENVQKCRQCKYAYYCSKDHQKEHWPTHKMYCKFDSRVNALEIGN